MYEGGTQSTGDDRPAAERTGPSAALIALVVLAILAVIFVVQNGTKTKVEFLFFEVKDISVWVAIAVSIAIGVLLNSLFGIWWRRRRRD